MSGKRKLIGATRSNYNGATNRWRPEIVQILRQQCADERMPSHAHGANSGVYPVLIGNQAGRGQAIGRAKALSQLRHNGVPKVERVETV